MISLEFSLYIYIYIYTYCVDCNTIICVFSLVFSLYLSIPFNLFVKGKNLVTKLQLPLKKLT